MTGVTVLTWFGLKYKAWSMPFIFYLSFAALTFFFTLLTAGRTALGASFLGVLVLLSRKLKRNMVVALAVLIITGPIILKVFVSFGGFEDVRAKLFSRESSGRGPMFKRGMNYVRLKPIVGWGTGSAILLAKREGHGHYHHSYLEFAIDHGVIFSLIMLCLFLWFPFRGLALMRRCYTEEMKNMANLSAALLAGYVFSSFLAGTLLMTSGILPAYMAIALQEGIRSENLQIEALYGQEDYYEEYLQDPMVEEQVLSGSISSNS
jgi:O-antigen ligase